MSNISWHVKIGRRNISAAHSKHEEGVYRTELVSNVYNHTKHDFSTRIQGVRLHGANLFLQRHSSHHLLKGYLSKGRVSSWSWTHGQAKSNGVPVVVNINAVPFVRDTTFDDDGIHSSWRSTLACKGSFSFLMNTFLFGSLKRKHHLIGHNILNSEYSSY